MDRGCLLSFVALLFAGFVLSQSSPSQCSYTSTTGATYDLSSLSVPVNSSLDQFYYFNDTVVDLGFYVFNICGSVNETLCDSGSAVCQVQNGEDYSCGLTASGVFSDFVGNTSDSGVTLTYSNGTFCPGPQTSRATIINVECMSGAAPTISRIYETSPCVYVVDMFADQGCPVNSNNGSCPSPMPSNFTVSPSVSISSNASSTPSVTANASVVLTATTSPSPVSSNATSPSVVVSVNATSPSVVVSVNATSPSVVVSVNATSPSAPLNGTASVTANSTTSNYNWVWWLLASLVVLVIVIVACVAGFVLWKKKQQSSFNEFDIEYE